MALREDASSGRVVPRAMEGYSLLVASPWFVVERYVPRETMRLDVMGKRGTAKVLVAIKGQGCITWPSGSVDFKCGEAVILPITIGSIEIVPGEEFEMLLMSS